MWPSLTNHCESTETENQRVSVVHGHDPLRIKSAMLQVVCYFQMQYIGQPRTGSQTSLSSRCINVNKHVSHNKQVGVWKSMVQKRTMSLRQHMYVDIHPPCQVIIKRRQCLCESKTCRLQNNFVHCNDNGQYKNALLVIPGYTTVSEWSCPGSRAFPRQSSAFWDRWSHYSTCL